MIPAPMQSENVAGMPFLISRDDVLARVERAQDVVLAVRAGQEAVAGLLHHPHVLHVERLVEAPLLPDVLDVLRRRVLAGHPLGRVAARDQDEDDEDEQADGEQHRDHADQAADDEGEHLVLDPHLRARVEGVAQAVAEEVQREHRQHDRDPGDEREPRSRLDLVLAARDHVAPRRVRGPHARAEEREAGLGEDVGRDDQREEDEHRGGDVREQRPRTSRAAGPRPRRSRPR